jgi:hypothetical protein
MSLGSRRYPREHQREFASSTLERLGAHTRIRDDAHLERDAGFPATHGLHGRRRIPGTDALS